MLIQNEGVIGKSIPDARENETYYVEERKEPTFNFFLIRSMCVAHSEEKKLLSPGDIEKLPDRMTFGNAQQSSVKPHYCDALTFLRP